MPILIAHTLFIIKEINKMNEIKIKKQGFELGHRDFIAGVGLVIGIMQLSNTVLLYILLLDAKAILIDCPANTEFTISI
jgi:hypothetical protein